MAVVGNVDEGGALVEGHPTDLVVMVAKATAAVKEWTEKPPAWWWACSRKL